VPANNVDTLLPFSLPSICQKKVTAAFDGGLISSDGGVLLLAGADRRLGLRKDPAFKLACGRLPESIGPFSMEAVFGELGMPRLRHLRRKDAMS